MLTTSSRIGPKGIRLFALALSLLLLYPSAGHSQTVTVLPDQIPNGITSPSQFRQRIDILLNGPQAGLTVSFTITIPPEVSVVTNSATVTSNSSALIS